MTPTAFASILAARGYASLASLLLANPTHLPGLMATLARWDSHSLAK